MIFFREISRGSLWKPTAEMFDLSCLCWMIFAEVSNNDLKKEFLSGHKQREVFMQLVYIAFHDNYLFQFTTTGGVCCKGHNLVEEFAKRFFNCLCKNFVRKLTEECYKKIERKVVKFSGK